MIRIRTLILRLLRVPCGDYGGTFTPFGDARWCLKTFGHPDSCAWEAPGEMQPLRRERLRAKGWDL
jgi:hypothetical protein